jgi:filamentous hemagglutinin
LIATGAGSDSNININGSSLTVSNDALFQADNDLNVNGVAQNSNTRSNNKSSSTAIGGYASFGQNTSAGITASASRGKGHANSDSTTYANSQINVGSTTTFDIGNDVNIKGGIINTNRAQGQIGGDVNIESLQDTAIYDSKQKNMGFSADIDIAGGGAGSSLSVNGGKTNLNADYQAVGEQSGIFTGDGGFDIAADGKTTLIGGAITTTAAARDAGRNNYESLGGIETQDIKNTTSYDGDAIQVGVSLGQTDNKPQASMNGLGYGSDSDSDSSVTRAGITGIAGSQDITTDNRAEYAGILENSFDAEKVNEELGAQVEITRAFDQERRKIKTEINAKEQKLRKEAEEQGQIGNTTARDNLIEQADKVQNQGLLFDAISGAIYGPNSNGATGYVAKAASPFVSNQIGQYFKQNAADNKVDKGNRLEEGSSAHLLAHTILGAAVSYATGNDVLSGGIAAGTGEVTAPLLSQFLYETTDPSKLTAEQKDTISAITSALGAGIGATTGSASNAANAAETSKVAVEDNGLLEVIMPETMSNVVVDQNKAKALKQQAQLRKITTKGALTAGYAPYIVGGAVVAPSVYGSLGTAAKTAIGSGASGSAIDAATQKYECFNCNFNIKQNVGVAISSGITGYYGAGMANAAGTTHVTMGNIYKNTKNPTGLVIFGNQQLLNQAASKSIKSATENQTQKDQKK